ncbi:MAG: hypothetical protein JKP98_00555 [Rhodobacteraceae bacterium]|jgi:hypothetical protein|nr:hypothetical protein [Paracoccaceae bacterium]MBL4556245.1 hypothetical protein [Paracoccaceae bacterium]
MLTKLLLLALAAFLVLRLLRRGGRLPGLSARAMPRPRRCPSCGTPIPGDGPCPCGEG